MFEYSVWFLVFVANGTAITVEKMPVANQEQCMQLVKNINEVRKPGGRSVYASCVATKKQEQ